jgi:tRNA 2-thiouridine synthesizing protein A
MNEDELKKLKADKVVDARGMACPGPLLEAKKAIKDVVKERMRVFGSSGRA